MRILNSIFGFILTLLIVFGIVYFTVPAVKDKVDGLFTPPAIEELVDDDTNAEEDPSKVAQDNVHEENDYSQN